MPLMNYVDSSRKKYNLFMQKAVLIMHLITKYILYTNMSKKQQHEHVMRLRTTVLYKSRGNDGHHLSVGPHV